MTRSRVTDVTLRPRGGAAFEIPATGSMRVPGTVFASDELLPDLVADRSMTQVANVATLPGIVGASFAMPDVHWGYGFPIGGVAATDVEAGGVVSPGGVGFDISCGVRLLVTDLRADPEEVTPSTGPVAVPLDRLDRAVPRGLGAGGTWTLSGRSGLVDVLERGGEAAVDAGLGVPADLERCEDGGRLTGVDLASVSDRALQRGVKQVGSLGSGNHFLEIQVVDRVLDGAHARAFGLGEGSVCVMIHTGSRGLGHQICTDHVRTMQDAMSRHGIEVPDRQLACAPVRSAEGERYLGAMNAAANYGRANRQALTHAVREAFDGVDGVSSVDVLYDVSHNIAKLEWHDVAGRRRLLCVHRKGATRALPPDHVDLPDDLRRWGQPVLVPGSMGTASWVLAGVEGNPAFDSACHGAGRTLSRHAAKRRVGGGELRRQLAGDGIDVRPRSLGSLAEEAPFAYKDVDEVVRVCQVAGLARPVVRLRPVGVVKG